MNSHFTSVFALFICILSGAPLPTRAQTISRGMSLTVLVTPDGSVWTWGRDSNGALDDNGGDRHVLTAERVVSLRSLNDNRFIFEEVEKQRDGLKRQLPDVHRPPDAAAFAIVSPNYKNTPNSDRP